MTVVQSSLEELRGAFAELMGAERRLRGRDHHRHGGLSISQMRALFQLAERDGATAGWLAKTAELSPASMSTMLDRLERDGILERRRSDEDRRVVKVFLTDLGREILAEKRAAWLALWGDALSGHDEEELVAAARVMRTLAALLDSVGRG